MSFILKLCFFLFYLSEKIDFLKATDAVNFEEVNKVKLYILPSKFQRSVYCNTYAKKLPSPACFYFCLFASSFLLVLLCESFWFIVTLSHLRYFE